jgi:hypothetical protein
VTFGPTVFDKHVMAFDIAGLAEALPKGSSGTRIFPGRSAIEKSDHRQCRLLRTRRERPHRCGAADERDEFATPHGAYPKARDQGQSIAGRGRASQQKRAAQVWSGSSASFEASSRAVRYYPERRHLLALQYLSQRANSRSASLLFDHVVGPELDCSRKIDADHVGSLEVDDQLEFHRLLDG